MSGIQNRSGLRKSLTAKVQHRSTNPPFSQPIWTGKSACNFSKLLNLMD